MTRLRNTGNYSTLPFDNLLLHSAESKFASIHGRLSPRNRNKIEKYFSVLISGLVAVDL
jgi:hypothetical protein